MLFAVWVYPLLSDSVKHNQWLAEVVLIIAVWIAISACRTLTDIYSLQRKEQGITWCQISILIAIGVLIMGSIVIMDIKAHPRFAAALGVIGSLLTWIFQDTIKGVVAFIHLRTNHLIHIDDWIQVPKYNVDGEVKRISLTMVTIYNWDTTTSSIPTSILHNDHFVNLQNMTVGKTYGRRMYKTFILDTSWIHQMTAEEVERLKSSEAIQKFVPKEEIREGVMNAQLYRVYLFHWLMNHPHVSQQPRLVVRWVDQVEAGLPLQIYAFITDGSLPAFEWQQSGIIEHVVESLGWFGLRLYQSPSAYDVSNGNIHLTDKEATYIKGN